ncbi:chaperone regulator [Cryptococcus neoformans]|nr:chaperone regulator [Cryptococcus neoformans var. grubii]
MASTELDSAIKKSANDLTKELEVERIMSAFKLNPYDILDLPLSATETDVKKQYRKKSLLIHPDKFKHEKGLEAFDFLKKAHDHLANPAKRKDIDMIMTHARTQVLKSILGDGYSTNISDDDPRLTDLSPPFEQQIRAKGREILVEDELARRRKQKLAYANEGAEKARAEAEVAARKRKVEEQAKWEGCNTISMPHIIFSFLITRIEYVADTCFPFSSSQNDEMIVSKTGETSRRKRRRRERKTICMCWDKNWGARVFGKFLFYAESIHSFLFAL